MRNVLLALLIPAAGIFSSCGDGDKVNPKPTIALSSGSGLTSADATVFKDSTVKFSIVGTSTDKEIASFNITSSTNGGTAGTLKDSTIGKSALNYTYNFKASGATGDKIKITFTVVDKNGEKASTSVTLTLKDADKNLSEEANQVVYNSSAPTGFKGAYDLATASQRAYTDGAATKDIEDKTAQGAATWSKTWGSGHGNTQFAVITANDYNNTSSNNDLVALWTAKQSTATKTITNITAGTFYVVKTGQSGVTFDYYVINIKSVNPSPSDKKDNVVFDYKHL